MHIVTENDFETIMTSLEFSDRNIVPYIIHRHCITNMFLSRNKL